jgi:hypothetical protein
MNASKREMYLNNAMVMNTERFVTDYSEYERVTYEVYGTDMSCRI